MGKWKLEKDTQNINLNMEITHEWVEIISGPKLRKWESDWVKEWEGFISLPLNLNICTSKVVKSDSSHFYSSYWCTMYDKICTELRAS